MGSSLVKRAKAYRERIRVGEGRTSVVGDNEKHGTPNRPTKPSSTAQPGASGRAYTTRRRKRHNLCTLLNLSLVSLPPPFLLFLGVIAKDITGSGTNIEVIASCVLSIVSAEAERVQRGCPISSFEVTSPQAPNGMAKRRAAAVPFLSLDMLYSPVKISPTGSLSPNMNTRSAGVRDFVLASATQNQHRLHKHLSRFSPNQ